MVIFKFLLIAHPHLLVWAPNEHVLPTLVTSSGSHSPKWAPASRSCSLIAHTNKCGHAVRQPIWILYICHKIQMTTKHYPILDM